MMQGSQPSTPGKPVQPQYTITSSGQLQMAGAPGQPGQPTFIMGPQVMQSPLQPGPQQPPPQASLATMKGSDGKPVMSGQPQPMGQQPQQQPQFLLPNGQMAYMQPGPGQPILQTGGQLIFRPAAPGTDQQQLMFSPGGPGQGPPQPPVQAATPPMPGQAMSLPQAPRPSMPPGPPPGKTAISRAIAPLLPTVSQSGPRLGYPSPAPALPNQPSPKSKQKMSPRGANVGPGRPPGPKSVSAPKMMAKMPGSPLTQPSTDLLSSGSPKPPSLQTADIVTSMAGLVPAAPGPPTLAPMLVPGNLPASPLTSSAPLPQSMVVTMPSVPVKPLYQMAGPLPTSTVAPLPAPAPAADSGPPMLTKEVNPPMPNLGPPNITGAPAPAPVPPQKTAPLPLAPQPLPDLEPPALTVTPKAVVKPQVVTHIIDGHVIKESSTPFPVSPSKGKATIFISLYFLSPYTSQKLPPQQKAKLALSNRDISQQR